MPKTVLHTALATLQCKRNCSTISFFFPIQYELITMMSHFLMLSKVRIFPKATVQVKKFTLRWVVFLQISFHEEGSITWAHNTLDMTIVRTFLYWTGPDNFILTIVSHSPRTQQIKHHGKRSTSQSISLLNKIDTLMIQEKLDSATPHKHPLERI